MATMFNRTTVEVHSGPSGPSIIAPPKPNGPAAAAILAAGIGCFALGLLVVVSEAIPVFKNALNLYGPVGPLSGKTIVQVAVYLVAWAGFAYGWRGRTVRFGRVFMMTVILLALGLVGTFPLVYEVFTAR